MKGQLDLDIKKLKEEDRRFLLNRYLTEAIASHQGSMYNTTMTFSLLALILAGLSLVNQTNNYWFVGIYFILALLGLIFYVRKYRKVQRNLKDERDSIGINYDELFKYHLSYSLVRKEENE
jgi:Ca2+/Na+ antiporter